MPNFLHYINQRSTDGELVSFGVEELTQEEAVEYAWLMRDEFIKHWERKKKQ
jgi:hypothetical protein